MFNGDNSLMETKMRKIFILGTRKNVGVSFVVANIAYGLSLEGNRVAIYDVDNRRKNLWSIPIVNELKDDFNLNEINIQTGMTAYFDYEKIVSQNFEYLIVDFGNFNQKSIENLNKNIDENSIFLVVFDKEMEPSFLINKLKEMGVKTIKIIENFYNWEETLKLEMIKADIRLEYDNRVGNEENKVPFIHKNYDSDLIYSLRDMIDMLIDIEYIAEDSVRIKEEITIKVKDQFYNVRIVGKCVEEIKLKNLDKKADYIFDDNKCVINFIKNKINKINKERWHKCH